MIVDIGDEWIMGVSPDEIHQFKAIRYVDSIQIFTYNRGVMYEDIPRFGYLDSISPIAGMNYTRLRLVCISPGGASIIPSNAPPIDTPIARVFYRHNGQEFHWDFRVHSLRKSLAH